MQTNSEKRRMKLERKAKIESARKAQHEKNLANPIRPAIKDSQVQPAPKKIEINLKPVKNTDPMRVMDPDTHQYVYVDREAGKLIRKHGFIPGWRDSIVKEPTL